MSIQSTKLVNLEDAQVLYNDLRDRESELKSALSNQNNTIKINLEDYVKNENTRYITETGDLHVISEPSEYCDAYKIDLSDYVGYCVRIKGKSNLYNVYTIISMCDTNGNHPMKWYTIESLLSSYGEWYLPIESSYPYLFFSKTHNAEITIEIVMGVEQLFCSPNLYKGYINTTGGVSEPTVTTRFHTDFIPCLPGKKVFYKGESNHSNILCIAFYNENKEFISGVANGGTIGTWLSTISPATTRYARISATVEKPWGLYYPIFGENEIAQSMSRCYVSISGNDSNDGLTRSTSVRTIQKAIDLGAKHILVREGSYPAFTIENKDGIHIAIDPEYSSFTAGTSEAFPHIQIDSNNNDNYSVLIKGSSNCVIENIEVENAKVSGFRVQRSTEIIFTDCIAHDIAISAPQNGSAGFEIVYGDVIFNNCIAYNIGTNTEPTTPTYHVDGFNMHGNGNTVFNDCSAWNCIDDGISHHDACEGTINGGEWYQCGKGGVASPTHGAKVNIYNVYSHDNMYGLYAGNSDAVTDRGNIIISNSIFLDNTEKDIYVDSYYHGFALNCVRQTIDATNIEFIGGSIPS